MQFYTTEHDYYCGIDLHARTMYVCIIDSKGKIVVERNMPSAPEPLLAFIAPYPIPAPWFAGSVDCPLTRAPD